jgi:hypothetical protein
LDFGIEGNLTDWLGRRLANAERFPMEIRLPAGRQRIRFDCGFGHPRARREAILSKINSFASENGLRGEDPRPGISESGADAPRPGQSCDRRSRAGSIRLAVQQSHSAKVTLM